MYGNGFKTIGYPANGEASDWMLGVHNIISFSPELGNVKEFYPPKNRIFPALQEEYKAIELFFRSLVPQLSIQDM